MSLDQALVTFTAVRAAPLPHTTDQIQEVLRHLYQAGVEPMRNWMIDTECALDELQHTAEELFEAAESERARIHIDLNNMIDCVLGAVAQLTTPAELPIPRQDRSPLDENIADTATQAGTG